MEAVGRVFRIALCVTMFAWIAPLTVADRLDWVEELAARGVGGVVADPSGDLFAGGWFAGTVDFDPGSEVDELVSNGYTDAFVLRWTKSGQHLWSASYGSVDYEYVRDFAADTLYRSYPVGNYSNAGIVTRLDPAGNADCTKLLLPVLPEGGPSDIRGVDVDLDGNLLLVGVFKGVLDMDPGPASDEVHTAGGEDIFIVKLHPDCTYAWGRALGTGEIERPFAVSVDGSGNVYVLGVAGVDLDFDPDPFNKLTIAASVFILKLDPDGDPIWVRGLDGVYALKMDLDADADGNVYAAGLFFDVLTLTDADGTFTVTSAGARDAFIVKLDADGEPGWGVSIGGSGDDDAAALDVTESGRLHIAGVFQDGADFDPGPGEHVVEGNGMYILRLDTDGGFDTVSPILDIGEDGSIDPSGVGASEDGWFYVGGRFKGSYDFDPAIGVQALSNLSGYHVFLAHYEAGIVAPGEASPPQTPMTVAKQVGNALLLSYDPAPCALDHTVYWGVSPAAMDGPPQWTDQYCSAGTSGTSGIDPPDPPSGSLLYFVIVGTDWTNEGSYGRDHAGVERPEAVGLPDCDFPQVLDALCD